MNATLTLPEIAARLCAAKCILLLTHSRPDGDTMGSAYALAFALQQKSPHTRVFVVNDDLLPVRLDFLRKNLPLYTTAQTADLQPDLIVSVDVAEEQLLSRDMQAAFGGKIDLKIDHHAMGADFAKNYYVDETAAACGEILYDIIHALDAQNPASASALYAAISSDTGGFRYRNTTPRTHRIVAALMEQGADFATIDHLLFESRTRGEIAAITCVYQNLQFYQNGEIAFSTLDNVQKTAHQISEADCGAANSILREIAGVRLGVLVKQSAKHPEEFKISMRSGAGVAANQLCACFGGGGHAGAAGGSVTAASMKEAAQYILKTVLQEYPNACHL